MFSDKKIKEHRKSKLSDIFLLKMVTKNGVTFYVYAD